MRRAVLPPALATGPPRLHVNPPVRLALRRRLPHRPLRSSIACGRRLLNPQHGRLRGVEMSLTALYAAGFPATVVENRHDGEIFRCRYDWEHGSTRHSLHVATLAFEHNGSHDGSTSTVRFIGRSVDDMLKLFHGAGFRLAR